MNSARPLARWWALPARDRILFTSLLAALPLVSFGLRVRGYRRTLALIEARSDMPVRRAASPADRAHAHHLARLLSIAGRRGLRATCLPQALLLHLLLRRRGLEPQLKLGMRRTDAQPDMHAWVELDGDSLDPAGITHVAFSATSPSDGQPHG